MDDEADPAEHNGHANGAASNVLDQRRPGRPAGLGRVPGSGRKKGTPNKVNRDVRELILARGRPVEFLCAVAAGRKIRVGPQAGPGDAVYVYPDPGMRMRAAELLLDKIAPSLRSSEVSVDEDGAASPEPEKQDRIELARRLAYLLTDGLPASEPGDRVVGLARPTPPAGPLPPRTAMPVHEPASPPPAPKFVQQDHRHPAERGARPEPSPVTLRRPD